MRVFADAARQTCVASNAAGYSRSFRGREVAWMASVNRDVQQLIPAYFSPAVHGSVGRFGS